MPSELLALAYHPVFLEHNAGPGHPECPERIEAVIASLESSEFVSQIKWIEARRAEPQEIAYVHNPLYIEAMKKLCEAGGEYLPQMEATVGSESWEAAVHAAGAGLTLADVIMRGEKYEITAKDKGLKNEDNIGRVDNPESLKIKIGFSPTRPPGHHALSERPMGFCIFNNIAILAKYLQNHYNVLKILIIDFDVHHGNGTESVFWEDPTVLYISLHRDNLFPYNKGRAEDCGAGAGRGFTLNIPLPAGSDDSVYVKAFDEFIYPRAIDFKPQFILVSAGFDAHIQDPLGGMRLTENGFKEIGRKIKDIANLCANGRIISLLEGGYDLRGLQKSVVAYLSALL